MSDPRNFLLTTDDSIDKVILIKEGSFSAAGSTDDYETIAHGLTFTPLVFGNWSLDSDFSTTRDIGSGTFPSGNPSVLFQTEVGRIGADSTNAYLGWRNIGSTTTVYYRIYGLAPSDVNPDVSSTADSADLFTLNLDYNYTKLAASGVSSGLSTGTNIIATHDLGYKPQTDIWMTFNSGHSYGFTFMPAGTYYMYDVFRTTGNAALTYDARISTTNLSLLIDSFATVPNKVHYRIYYDE